MLGLITLTPPNLPLAFAKIPFIMIATIGMHISFSSPNPPAPKSQRVIRREGPIEIQTATFIGQCAFWTVALIEIFIIVLGNDSSPLHRPSELQAKVLGLLLPSKHANQIYATTGSILGSLLIGVGTAIRVACYRALGKEFTFEVSVKKDHRLVTIGPYSWVRHPAYTGGLIAGVGLLMYYGARGAWLIESGLLLSVRGWVMLSPILAPIFLPFITIWWRVSMEDAALKAQFGEAWEAWAKDVPYALIPGIY